MKAYSDVDWQIVIRAFAEVFDEVLWVDFGHTGPQNGGFLTPYNRLSTAVDAASPGQTIRLKPGSSSETGTFNRRVTLRGFDGLVTIGE